MSREYIYIWRFIKSTTLANKQYMKYKISFNKPHEQYIFTVNLPGEASLEVLGIETGW